MLKERLSEDPSAVPAIEYKANIRYLVMTSAAEHWIPFITVHLENDIREIQLQRAAMPRILEGDPPDKKLEKVRPQMVLMQSGLDKKKPYFIYEEEIPRVGILVTQSFQHTHWHD